MEGEFNDYLINNTPITFTGSTNNIATSDELSAPLLYQDTLGTKYSKQGKRVARFVGATGIALLVTAAAVRTGSVLTNGFVLNAPVVENGSFLFEEGEFKYEFTIANKGNYEIKCFITINGVTKFSDDCSEEKTYSGTFNEIQDGERGNFYVEFSNKVDYKKKIKNVRFTTKGIAL